MTPSGMRARGFTLIELMIVVTIIGILAVIGGQAYKRYGSKARASEVFAMLSEFRAKEEAYRAEYSMYCNTSGCATVQNEATYFPALIPGSEPSAKPVMPLTIQPLGWQQMGINPGKQQLYCGYNVVAGAGGVAPAGATGQKWFNYTTPTGAWWYGNATCDLDGNPATNSIYTTGGNNTAVTIQNEGS